MEYASIEDLTAPGQTPEDDVQLVSGRWVRVRGLTRAEAIRMQDIQSTFERERYGLSRGMLIPRMNEPQVEAWMKAAAAGEMSPASDRITQLSGMDEGAEKEAVRDFETGKVSEFRVLPGDETESDGDGTTSDDQ